jgi:hypothetical protein
MTSKDQLIAINKFRVNEENFQLINRSSFEETVDILIETAAYCNKKCHYVF